MVSRIFLDEDYAINSSAVDFFIDDSKASRKHFTIQVSAVKQGEGVCMMPFLVIISTQNEIW